MKLQLEDIKEFLVLGSGTLGLRVGLQAAISGFEVKIYDIDEKQFEKARQIHQQIGHYLIKKGILTPSGLAETLSHITFTTNAAKAASQADFISESVTENLELKKKVWAQFGEICPEKTIFTTNTSYLLPSMFAAETGRPQRFCAFHFHDVFSANVVDIMPHPGTEAWVVDLLMKMGRKLAQTPVLVNKESPGYLFNAMLMALIGAAGSLVTHQVGSIEDIDRSWMGNFKMDRGPFGILDAIGLDTAWHVTNNMQDERSKKFAALLKQYTDAGKLGEKTGEGFYTYPNPAFKDKDFLEN